MKTSTKHNFYVKYLIKMSSRNFVNVRKAFRSKFCEVFINMYLKIV